MSLPRALIGHIYSPPTIGKDASIFEWFINGSPHAVETLEGTFLKVAYVLPLQENEPNPNTENIYEPVYMDMRLQPNPLPFTVPDGWRQLCVCSDEGDLTIRPVIQKAIELGGDIVLVDPSAPLMDHRASLTGPQLNDAALILFDEGASWIDDTEYNGTSFDNEFLSTISSFTGEWTGADTSAFEIGFQMPATGSDILPLVPVTANMELPYSPPAGGIELEYNAASDVLIPIPDIALPNGTVTSDYVLCEPVFFANDIKYSKEYIKNTFPAADICICDAIIHAKQRLIAHDLEETLFRACCKQYIIEMVTIANHSGRPVELGLKCLQGNITMFKPLYMLSKGMIDLVFQERAKFIRALKEICGRLAEEPEKTSLGGFCLKDYTSETVVPYIAQLTGLTVWDGKVTSIMFTRSSSGKYYCRMPILVILALRILQRPRNQKKSLLDIFPHKYKALPENLLASACGTYVIFFRCRLPRCPWTSISADDLEEEIAQQLQLLRTIRQNESTDLYARELNTWINTRDGVDGWLQDLTHALSLVNKQRGISVKEKRAKTKTST